MSDSKNYQRSVLLMVVFTAFLTTFVSSALNLSIPNIESEFATNAVTVGWVVSGYTMGTAVFCVPIGKIADVIGRKKVLVAGLAAFLAFGLACMFAGSIYLLIAFRFMHGVSAACLFATNNAIALSVFPGDKRGYVLGISVGATYTGLSVGPVVGGFLNTHFGWRSILIITIINAAIALYLAVTGCPADEREAGKSVSDVPGNIIYMLMIGAFLFGFSNIESMVGKSLIGVTVLLAVAFVMTENRADNPVIKVSMFTQDIVFTLSNIAALLNYSATFAVTYLISIYLQVVMGFSSQISGLILIAMPVVQAMFAPKMGKLSDRIPPYKLATAGMGCCVAGLVMFATLSVSSGITHVVIALLIMGAGFALFSSPNTNAIMSRVSKADYSIANSIVSTMRTVGQSFSMALVSVVVTMNLGGSALSEASPEAIAHTMKICFSIFVGLCIVGTVISMKRGSDKTV